MSNKYIARYDIGHPVIIDGKQAIVIAKQCNAVAWIYKLKYPGDKYDELIHFHSDNFDHMPRNCS